MSLVKKTLAGLLFLLGALSGAAAQTPGNFVQGAVLCANFGCSSVSPVNPMGLNEAFAAKADYPGILSANNVWLGSNQFVGFVNVPTVPSNDNSNAAANTSFVHQLFVNGNFVTGNFGPSQTALAADGQVLLAHNGALTAKQIYLPFSVSNGEMYDVIRGVLDFQAITVGSLTQANAVGGYANCAVTTAVYPNYGACVGVQGFTTVTAAGAIGWGMTAVVQDSDGMGHLYAKTVRSDFIEKALGNRSLIGLEVDTGVDDNTGTTQSVGILVGLQGTGASASTLRGIVLNAVTTHLTFSFGIDCEGGSMGIACLNVGPQTITGGASASQLIAFEYWKAANSQFAMTLSAPATGGFKFGATDTTVTNWLDISAVAPSGCNLLISSGCALAANGNFFAQTNFQAINAGSANIPNFRLQACGVCGLYAPATGQIAWAVGSAPIMDFGITAAATFSFDVNISFGNHSAYGGGNPNSVMNFYSTYAGTHSGDNVHFQASTLVFDNWSVHLLDYNLTNPGYWTAGAPAIFANGLWSLQTGASNFFMDGPTGRMRWQGQGGTPPGFLTAGTALEIVGPAAVAPSIAMYGYAGLPPGLFLFSSNGTLGAETMPGLGFNTGIIGWRGWTGAGYGPNNVVLVSFTPVAWSAGNFPLYLQLKATPIGQAGPGITSLQVMGGVVIGAGTVDPGQGQLDLTGSAFASLPAAPPAGTLAYITDAIATGCADTTCTTFGTNITAGGGALKKLGWWNGTNWKLIGQ
jgi:hypothetical protein